MPLSDSEIEDVFADVRGELGSMSSAHRERVTRSRESFLAWLYDALKRLASYIGEVVSAPFKALFNIIAGFFEGLFRW